MPSVGAQLSWLQTLLNLINDQVRKLALLVDDNFGLLLIQYQTADCLTTQNAAYQTLLTLLVVEVIIMLSRT